MRYSILWLLAVTLISSASASRYNDTIFSSTGNKDNKHNYSKQIALSFDDSPNLRNGYLTSDERSAMLLNSLAEHSVEQVAFFSVSYTLNQQSSSRLRAYSNAGHIIANHTHSHPNADETELQGYIQEIATAHQALKDFPTFKKWFRFPYLSEGADVAKRDGIRQYLHSEGYFNGYVTINTFEWYIESLFLDAIKQGKTVNLKKLEDFFVDTMIEGIEHYDTLSQQVLSRSPKHVLLLHETDVTALFTGALITKLRTNGWEIINIEDAYKDPIADYKFIQSLPFNPGRVGEIAMDRKTGVSFHHKTLQQDYLKSEFEKRVLSSE